MGRHWRRSVPGLGFALVVFGFGDELRDFRYISNAQRADMIGAFDALLTKWKNESPKHN
jgi:hypothetical protein